MNKTSAAARLGLSGVEDALSITRAYGAQLGKLQQQLVAAHNDQERHESQAQLAELVEAYEFLTQSGRHAGAQNDDETKARPAGDATTEMGRRDTFIRLETGAVLSDRLEVGPMLGQGGMGYVYAARDRLKNENVAIKVLRHDLLFSVAAKERFLAEAKVSCNFSHPNIVNVYDVGVSGGNYYFSMELLKGQTLRQRIEKYHRDRRLFTTAEVNEITRQLVDALRYAHRYIVHRDIKPENIWLEHDGTLKLMDFGIAHAYSNSDMTQTGMTLGTAYYMAPEQRTAAKEVDWRADQYSLGIVLYELMAGTVPMGAARPLELLRRDVPKRYARALMRAIAPRPDDRWPSLQEFLAELNARQRTTGWATTAAVLAGVALAAAAGVGLYLYRNSAPGPTAQQTPAKPPATVLGAGDSTAQAGTASGPSSADPNTDPTAVIGTKPALSSQQTSSQGTGDATQAAAKPGGDTGVTPPQPDPDTKPLASKPPKPASDRLPPRGPTPEQQAALSNAASLQREQCTAQCSRDDAECRSINRRGRQECARAAAFGGSSAATSGNNCGFFGPERCQFASDRDACLRQIASRRTDCLRGSSGSMINRRQDCDKAARDADQMCLSQLQDCRVSCQ